MLQFEKDYRTRGDLLTDEFFNKRFSSVDGRIHAIETISGKFQDATNALISMGLERVNIALKPVVDHLTEMAGIGVMFVAHSETEVPIALGHQVFTVLEGERLSYAAGGYLAAFSEGDLSKAVSGRFVSYDASIGELVLDVDRLAGDGVASDWVIYPISAMDFPDQASRAEDAAGQAADAAATAVAAASSANGDTIAAVNAKDLAVSAKNQAVAARDTTQASLASLDLYYLGAKATNPTVSNTGGPLVVGMQYFNTTAQEMRVYKATGWEAEYVSADSSVASVFGRTGTVGAADGDYSATQIVVTPAGGISSTRVQAALEELDNEKANLASPAFTGTPTAPTPSAADNSTKLSTTAYVTSAVATGVALALSTIRNGVAAGFDTLFEVAAELALKAPLASPALTGNPTAPTQAAANNSTRIATTAFVQTEIAAKAPLASPAFTGAPTAPTATVGTNSTQLATTAYVIAALNALINAAPGALDTLDELAAALGDDPNFATTMTNALAAKAALASPAFTGTPTAPTAAADTSTTQIATTAYVQGELTDRVVTSRSVVGSGLASGGGTLAADRTITVPKATATEVRGATNDANALTAKSVYDGLAEVTIAYGATMTVNLTTGINFVINTMTGNGTLANPSGGLTPGKSGRIRIIQDATGSRTLAYGSYWDFEGGTAPSLSTAANAEDYLDYEVITATKIRARLSKAWS